jgi:1-deoxy-D-xylulose-5-phosphate synthase
VTIVTYGTLLQNALEAAELLSQAGIEATVLRLSEVSDLDVRKIAENVSGKTLLILEEVSGGTGIAAELALKLGPIDPSLSVYSRDLGANFVPHGSINELYEHCGLDAKSVAEYIQEVLR